MDSEDSSTSALRQLLPDTREAAPREASIKYMEPDFCELFVRGLAGLEPIRHQVQSAKAASGEAPRDLSDEEAAEIRAFGDTG
jgi:hypothetical protein